MTLEPQGGEAASVNSAPMLMLARDKSVKLLRLQPRMRASAETSTAAYHVWQAAFFSPSSRHLLRGWLVTRGFELVQECASSAQSSS